MAITLDVITRVTEASLRGSSKQIQNQMERAGQQSGEGFAKSFSKGVASSSADMAKAFDKAADAAGKLRVEQQKLDTLQEKKAGRTQLIAQSERVAKAQRDEARAVNDATQAYARYDRQTRDLTNGLDVVNRGASGVLNVLSNLTSGTRFGGVTAGVADMASGFSTAGVAVGGMGASMTAAAGIAGGVLVVALAAAAAGAVALTNELYDLGTEWDNTFDSIIVKTGATGDVLQDIKNSVKEVAGEVPASLGEIGEVAAGVAQNLKLVGPAADDIIKSLAVLKNNGYDVDIHDLGMAFRALEIEQDNYQGTLEQFLGLSQRTGVSIDSITGAIGDNAGALKEFGFSAGEVVTIMDMFDKVGIDPDKGIGALGKAFKALTDAGLEPTKENLQLVFDDINRLVSSGQISTANEQLNTLFGARGGGLAWADLIKDGTLNLNELANATEAPRSSIQDMQDQTYDFAEQWEMTVNDAKTALEPFSTALFEFVNDSLGGITEWIKDNKPEIIGFFTGLATQIANVAQVITGLLGQVLYDIGLLIPDALGGKKFENAGKSLMNFSAKVEYLQNQWQAAGDRANTAAEFARDLGDNIKLLPDKKTVVLEDTTPEVLEAIDKTKYEVENLPDGQVKITAKTDEATREMQAWIDDQNGIPIEPEVKPDVGGADDFLDKWKKTLEGEPIDIPVTASDPFNPGGVLGPNVGTPGGKPRRFAASGAGAAVLRDFSKITPASQPGVAQSVNDIAGIAAEYGLEFTSGRRNEPGSYHNVGLAGDFSNGSDLTQEQRNFAELLSSQFGDQIAELIYGDPNFKGNIGGPFSQETLDEHRNHVHVAFKPGADIGSGGMMNFGPDGGGYSPLPPGTPSPIPGLEPGPVGSTPGYNEFGEPGYYRPDSDQIRAAERAKDRADKSVSKAQERLGELQQDIADLEAQRTVLNSKDTDKKIAAKNDQIADLQDQLTDLQENAAEQDRRVADARQGRFTQARESRRGGKSGGMGQIGADLADDFGISEGLPGMAQWLTTFLANLAFAPMLGQLSAISAAAPYQGGYGAIGVGGAQAMAANGGTLFPQPGLAAATTPGPTVPPVSPATIGPAPLGGGVGTPHLTGAAPGPTTTPNTSMAPSAASGGGGGFGGIGGAPMAAITGAASGLDLLAPGAGQAAQTGIQLANRAIAYGGQLAAIGVGGLMETLLPNNSPLADPGKSWVGKIAAGFAGARPATPNTAGGDNPAGASAKPQTPEEAAALQQQNGQGQGPLVNIENMVNQTPDSGQQVANQIGRHQAVAYASGGPR